MRRPPPRRRQSRDLRPILAAAAALVVVIIIGVVVVVVMHRAGPADTEPDDLVDVRRPVDTSLMPSEYTVEAGDTLDDIATNLGVPALALRAVNDLGDSDSLDPGQVLIVPPVGIVVQEADPTLTIRELGQMYGVEPFTLAAYNGIVRDLVDVPLGRTVVILPDTVAAGDQ